MVKDLLKLVGAVLLVVAIVALALLFVPGASDVLLDWAKDVAKAALGGLGSIGVTLASWHLLEKRLYDGWVIRVTNLDGETIEKALPAQVVKKWLDDELSDFGGFRDLTGSVNRWKRCGMVAADADTAKSLGALTIDRSAKVLSFDYTKLPAAPARTQQ